MLIPKIMHSWRPTGDEPHYLVITKSLVYDHDLDLRNNYEQGPDIPHVVVRPDGTWRPTHDIGLPLVMCLPFILGNEFGVYVMLSIIAALIGCNIFLFAFELTHRLSISILAWLFTAFLPPGFFYAFQLYPEMLGALLLLWSARLLTRDNLTNPQWSLVGFFAACMPWLVARFATLTVLITLIGLYSIYRQNRHNRQAAIQHVLCLILPSIAISIIYLFFLQHYYGRPSPMAMHPGPGYVAINTNILGYLQLLVGWLIDQRMGLLLFSPVLFMVFAGLFQLYRTKDWRCRIVVLISIYHYLSLIVLLGGFWVQFSVPNRYLIVIIPFLMVSSACAFISTKSILVKLVAFLLVALSLSNAFLVLNNQQLAYPLYFNRSPLWARYASIVKVDVTKLLPLIKEPLAVLKFNEKLDNGKQVYFTSGFDVIQGLVITDHSAQSERAAIIDPLGGERAPWLTADTATKMPVGVVHLQVRAKYYEYQEPAARPGFTVVVYSSETEKELVRQTTSTADLGEVDTYKTLDIAIDNPTEQVLRISILYDDQVPISLDFLSYGSVVGWWPSWGLVIVWCTMIALFTCLAVWRRAK
ncbi:MAG: glycosyltransferase family protein [Anaerolineae bacterium]